MSTSARGSLTTTRSIAASPERLFRMWTEPEHVQRWWGPEGVECPFAEIDLRPGGAYCIANKMSDGSVILISGVFEVVEPPSRLVYTWTTDKDEREPERVTVSFVPQGDKTEVTVLHELIPDAETAHSHEIGWNGCLAALEMYVGEAARGG